ncbi:MAG TPA: hypothetical protein VKH35_06625 [Thermoanaerobaculia bacterium]|nr:hypothetical protein [Thermoanaerobaculia bacterium]
MRSNLAARLREEKIEELRRMTPAERVQLVLRLRTTGLDVYAAGQHIDRDTALARIRRSRQSGRRYSRCMDELLR